MRRLKCTGLAAATLALAARGWLAESLPEVRSARRAGLRTLAIGLMRARFHRADLTPAGIAGALGISLRHLHLLFEESPHSFSRTLAILRVEEAHKLLVEQPELPVLQVAQACGYRSPSRFAGLFRARFGLIPSATRPVSRIDD